MPSITRVPVPDVAKKKGRRLIVWRSTPQIKNPRRLECYFEGSNPAKLTNILVVWCKSNARFKKGHIIDSTEYHKEFNIYVIDRSKFRRRRPLEKGPAHPGVQ